MAPPGTKKRKFRITIRCARFPYLLLEIGAARSNYLHESEDLQNLANWLKSANQPLILYICRKHAILMNMQIDENLQIDRGIPPQRLPYAISLELPPLRIRPIVLTTHRAESGLDAIVQVEFGGKEHTFLAEYRADWTPRVFEAAIARVVNTATPSPEDHSYPMVILPYLSEEKLSELAERRISGLDLCGNGVIIIPGEWFISRSGRPNRFRTGPGPGGVNPFRGRASLVARTLLRKPAFPKLSDLLSEIKLRSGTISLALVSRAVQHLQEELIVTAEPGTRVRLMQPEKLMDGLLRSYQAPRVSERFVCRVALPTTEFLPRLFQSAEDRGIGATMTGLGSAAHHVPIIMENRVRMYAEEWKPLVYNLENSIRPGEPFANLEINVPRDPLVYYDTDRDEQGVIWSSQVQTYLEMMQAGDARLQEGAQNLRRRLLSDLERQYLK